MQAQSTPPERKYTLTKLEEGDYLLPSNDGQSIWRIAKYTDGPTSGLEIPRDRIFWGAWRWDGPFINGAVDTQDWDRWNMEVTLCATRQDAIREALRLG